MFVDNTINQYPIFHILCKLSSTTGMRAKSMALDDMDFTVRSGEKNPRRTQSTYVRCGSREDDYTLPTLSPVQESFNERF